MIINKLVFPIKSDLSFVEGGIPQGMLTANSINRDILYVISPAVKETVITAFFQNQKQTEDTQQATFILSDLSIDYLVSKDTSYYELVKDWNVWQTTIPSKALEFISYNRAGKIGISFAFKQLLEPSGYEGSQEITNDNFVINDSGSYIIKIPYYNFLGIDFTYNDVLIYNGGDEVSKKPAIALQGTTGTLEYSVDPSVYMGGYEEVDIGLTESILSKLGENSGDIKLLRLKFNNYYTNEEVDGLLGDKVDKIKTGTGDPVINQVYGTDYLGNEKVFKASQSSVRDSVVQRDSYGFIYDLLVHNNDPNAHPDITALISSLDLSKVNKTQKIIGIDLQDDILLTEFKTALGNATQSVAGLLSAEDKTHLDGLVALLENSDGNTVVDTIGEILEIFNNYPEGADLVTALNGKVDKVAGKALSQNDFTDALKNKLDGLLNGSQYYDKNYIDALKDKNGWESELLGTLSNNETIDLSVINQYDEIQMYAKDTLGVIDNENIRPSLMQSGDSVYFFDDTQAFVMVDTDFGFYAPVGYTLQVVGLKYTELKAIDTTYDNTVSELTATTVQGAIDELEATKEDFVVKTPYFYKALQQYMDAGKDYATFLVAWKHSLTVDVVAERVDISNNYTQHSNYDYQAYGIILPEGVLSVYNSYGSLVGSYNKPIVFPDSVTTIQDFTFVPLQDNTKEIVLPSSLHTILEGNFSDLKSDYPVVIPFYGSVIGDGAFYSSTIPYMVMLPQYPPSIASYTFGGSSTFDIYVSDIYYDDYYYATNWVNLRDRLKKLSELELGG